MELEEIKLKNGSVLVSVTDYGGEADFYAMYDIIGELLSPEDLAYGVDSLSVGGGFRKDGIVVRINSDCFTDCCCFEYPAVSPEDEKKIKGWINAVVEELHKRLPR